MPMGRLRRIAALAVLRLAETCSVSDDSCSVVSESPDTRWEPKTLSVVLPCAGEGEFASKTVKAVSASVPEGILAEIVVVDDGSKPALGKSHLKKEFRSEYGVKLVRHKQARGLIRAKSAGAAAATGDIIVFFDCHVAPRPGWHVEFLKSSAENYRRIVVPVITDLDIDSWTERRRATGHSKCYLTWDMDFKWFESTTADVPVLSGGLLGISRRWWNETGGYDKGMAVWGGENIDQSLRTWLCGGEIVSLDNAFVAHMWRNSQDSRTEAQYETTVIDPLKNRLRAGYGWLGSYIEKLHQYPYLNPRILGVGKQGVDVGELHAVRDRLGCRPFAWFLWRFRDVYEDSGLLPDEVFQLQETKSGLCLTYNGPSGTNSQGRAIAKLMPCDAPSPGMLQFKQHPNATMWHLGNKEHGTGRCCSGLRSWNTDQCLGSLAREGILTTVCGINGKDRSQFWRLSGEDDRLAPGQLQKGDGNCVVALRKKNKDGGESGAGGSFVLRPRKCLERSDEAPVRWRKLRSEEPLETRLYREAKTERPELFS